MFSLKSANICFVALLTCCSSLYSSVSDHLRACPKEKECQSIPNIDCIYLINLDQRPEKLQRSLEQLAPYGIVPWRFPAVNGWELSLEELNDVGLKYSPEMDRVMATSYLVGENFEPCHESMQNYGQTYFCHCLSRGAIGIALSHLSILQDAVNCGYETIWVMEDDIEVLQDPRILSDLIDRLNACVGKGNWDILFTDQDIRDGQGHHKACYSALARPDYPSSQSANNYALKEDVSEEFRRIGARWGAHSLIFSRSGMKKLLAFLCARQIFFPFDMEYLLPRRIRLFNTRRDIVSNLPMASSDNGGPNYLQHSK